MEFIAPVEVGIRLRPVLETDDPPSDERVEVLDTGQLTVEGHVFDVSFSLAADLAQQQLYQAVVEPLVILLLQGYNVSVVGFGQTGSGKTYTLIGPEALFAMSEMDFGIIPRAVRHVFSHMDNMLSSRELCDYAMTVRSSYIEINQEEIRDLLNYEPLSYHLSVEVDDQGAVVIPGLTHIECSSMPEALNCLESGSSMRQAGSTAPTPLQSHTVFSLNVEQQWTDGVSLQRSCGTLHFVELCGSELQPAPDDPDDFTIDAGLLALKDVVEAQAYSSPDVPYQSHPLTSVLRDMFGGNSKTVVLCCISPADTDESLNSLQYISTMRSVSNWVRPDVSSVPLAPPPQPPPPPLQHQQSAVSPRDASFMGVGGPPAPPPAPRLVHPVMPFQQHHQCHPAAPSPQQPKPPPPVSAPPAVWPEMAGALYHQPPPPQQLPPDYNPSPPLTDLSYQRAALHENLLIDLYQRIHVLEVRQLAVAQPVAPPVQPPPPPQEQHSNKGADDETLFQLQFATEQYRQLVAGAERLLRELSLTATSTDRRDTRAAVVQEHGGRIQEWLCRKMEFEECLQPMRQQLPGAAEEDSWAAAASGGEASSVASQHQQLPVQRLQKPTTAERSVASPPQHASHPAADGSGMAAGSPLAASQPAADKDGMVTSTPLPDSHPAVDRGQIVNSSPLPETHPSTDRGQVVNSSPLPEAHPAAGGMTTSPPHGTHRGSSEQERLPCRPQNSSPVNADDQETVFHTSDPALAAITGRRRRRQACTVDDIRVLQDTEELRCLRACADAAVADAESPERTTCNDTIATQLDTREPSLVPVQPISPTPSTSAQAVQGETVDAAKITCDRAAIRRQIQKLRDCRDCLHSQRLRINAKAQGRPLEPAETRRLLELDEALNAVDEVIEHKNLLSLQPSPTADGRQLQRLLLNQRELMPRLLELPDEQLRALYCRTFQRLVDCRLDGRDKDLAVAELDAQLDGQASSLKRLQRMVHDLMRERTHYKRQRDELRQLLHRQQPRGSSTAAAAPSAAPQLLAAAAGQQLTSSAVASLTAHSSRAPSDVTDGGVPVSVGAVASHRTRLRHRVLRGLMGGPSASTAPLTSHASLSTRVTRHQNGRVIIQAPSQAADAFTIAAPGERRPRR